MRERLESLIESPYEEPPRGHLPLVLRPPAAGRGARGGLDPFFAPVTPADRLALLLERIDDLTMRHHEIRGNPAPLLAGFVARIDRLKDEMVTRASYRRTREARGAAEDEGDDAARRTRRARAGVRRRLRRPRAPAGRARRPGLRRPRAARLPAAARAARTCASARPQRFRHVLVDEYQDMNFAQGMLLRLLCEDHRQVTVVGDDDQAIYRFRGASQKNLGDFQREFTDAAVVRLERNYRSGRRILEAARAVVEPCPDRIEKELKGAAGGRVRFWRCRSERAQAQAIAAEAERLIADGISPDEICVLVRSVRGRGGAVVVRARGARRARSRTPARRPTSSAPRCATCSPGCACWPTRATPGPWCAPSRARRSSSARWTWRGSPSCRGGASSTCRRRSRRRSRGRSSPRRGATARAAFLRLYRSACQARSRTAGPTHSCCG